MNYYKKDIKNVRGDTYSLGLRVEESDQALDSCYFTCRDNLNDDSQIIFQKKLNDGITLVEESDNTFVYSIRIAPEDTRDIQSGIYYYDLQITMNNDVFTVMRGKFIVEQDSTWEEE